MKLEFEHRWDLSPGEARALQAQMSPRVECRDRFGEPHRVAGVDVGFDRRRGLARAAVAVLALPSLEKTAQSVIEQPVSFPYVPGLLSFREIPAVLTALDRLERLPDLILCDAQGYAHPRRFGLACHLGVLTGVPTVGVAKSRLLGEHRPVPERRGAWVELVDKGETIGAVLRTRPGTRPLFVSIGHRVSLASACELVMRCTTRYRLPETTRHADRLASAPRLSAR